MINITTVYTYTHAMSSCVWSISMVVLVTSLQSDYLGCLFVWFFSYVGFHIG